MFINNTFASLLKTFFSNLYNVTYKNMYFTLCSEMKSHSCVVQHNLTLEATSEIAAIKILNEVL